MCPGAWDQLLCWPPTPAGEMAYLPCPPLKGIDPTRTSYSLISKQSASDKTIKTNTNMIIIYHVSKSNVIVNHSR